MRKPQLLFVLSLLSLNALAADRVEPSFVRDALGVQNRPAAPRIALQSAAEPLVTLAAAVDAVPEQLDAMHQWNAEGRLPYKNGFTRAIGGALQARIAPATSIASASAGIGKVTTTERGSAVWSGSVRVAGAHRLRLHLRNVHVPPGTTFWVYGKDGEATAFGLELLDDRGEIYAPSIAGEVAYLEAEFPANTAGSFDVVDVLELFAKQKGPVALDLPTCLVDAKCVNSSTLDVIDQLGRAVAHLQYVKSGDGFVCSGGLINDTDDSGTIPYLLTANHCFSAQSSASSLEAYWDYRTAACNALFPNFGTPSNGSQLIASSASTDFTLVRMNSIPSGRILLGWDSRTSAVPDGTALHRISHPFPDDFDVPAPQFYSRTTVNTTSSTCSARPRPNYLYSSASQGGTYGGSSGSPVILAGGYIVGQLFGACGPNPSAGCDTSNRTVDGAFSATYPAIASFINPTTSSGCTPNGTTACMLANRFKVTVRYRAGFDTAAPDTNAQVKSVSGFASSNFESAFFYFNSEANIEMLVKILDQGNTNNSGQQTIAVLFATATPLGIEVTITDTKTGALKKYTSTFGSMQGATDFTAFVK